MSSEKSILRLPGLMFLWVLYGTPWLKAGRYGFDKISIAFSSIVVIPKCPFSVPVYRVLIAEASSLAGDFAFRESLCRPSALAQLAGVITAYRDG